MAQTQMSKQPSESKDEEEVVVQPVDVTNTELSGDIDDILNDIDEVLTDNEEIAQTLIDQFIQSGGE